MGCDAISLPQGMRLPLVSIHAPAWGATRSPQRPTGKSVGFNPRTRMGCDLSVTAHGLRKVQFQSTHPHGVRLGDVPIAGIAGLFQSTHPHGVRPARPAAQRDRCKFQSTHPHGVRRYWYGDGWHGQAVSIHAPAWGATRKARRSA